MEPTNDQLLLSISKTLTEKVAPKMLDKDVSRLLQLAVLAVEELRRRDTIESDPRSILNEKLEALLSRGENLAEKRQLLGIAGQWPDRPEELKPKIETEQRTEELWARLTALVDAMLRGRQNSEFRHEINQFISAVVAIEAEEKTRSVKSSDPDTLSMPTAKKLAALAAYFGRRLGFEENSRIDEVRELSGGFSNETLLVTVVAGEKKRSIVVRLSRNNSINSPYAVSLEEEVPFLQLAESAGVPVPKPLWLETDKTLLGGYFLVVEYVPGRVIGSSLQAAGELSDILLENYARALARLHAAPWQQWVGRLGSRYAPRAGLTVTDSLTLILERMRDYLEAAWISPSPLIVVLFDWLERNKPESDIAPVLTHGDLGFHNWLFDGDEPVALLDWETVALCSHTKDLANVRDVVVPPGQWDLFLSAYVGAGGSPLVEEELHYYAVLRQIQALICTSVALEKMFTCVDPLNIDYLELGVGARDYFYREILSGLEDLIQ